jgi:hypothetical protein
MKTKNIVLYASLMFFAGIFSGCYTVAWSPDKELPDDGTEVEETECYYPQTYYGSYNSFYGGTWWSHSSVISESIKSARALQHARNQNNSRTTETSTFTVSRPTGNSSNNIPGSVGTVTGGGAPAAATKTKVESSRGSTATYNSNSTATSSSDTNKTDNNNTNSNSTTNSTSQSNGSSSSSNSNSDNGRGSNQGSGNGSDRGRR